MGTNLELPPQVYQAMSSYLMLSIGLKGGSQLAAVGISSLLAIAPLMIVASCLIALWSTGILHKWLGMDLTNSAAVAAHYGSVSAVTFVATTGYLASLGLATPGWGSAMLAILEAPAIILALWMATRGSDQDAHWADSLREILGGKSVLLLVGGMLMGLVCNASSLAVVTPFFITLFPGVLCLFLLTLGSMAADNVSYLREAGAKLVLFAILAPLVHGSIGLLLGWMLALSVAETLVLCMLLASASYIAAPAAVKMALPNSRVGVYLTMSLAITFPFNICVGIPLFATLASWLLG